MYSPLFLLSFGAACCRVVQLHHELGERVRRVKKPAPHHERPLHAPLLRHELHCPNEPERPWLTRFGRNVAGSPLLHFGLKAACSVSPLTHCGPQAAERHLLTCCGHKAPVPPLPKAVGSPLMRFGQKASASQLTRHDLNVAGSSLACCGLKMAPSWQTCIDLKAAGCCQLRCPQVAGCSQLRCPQVAGCLTL